MVILFLIGYFTTPLVIGIFTTIFFAAMVLLTIMLRSVTEDVTGYLFCHWRRLFLGGIILMWGVFGFTKIQLPIGSFLKNDLKPLILRER